MSPAHHRSSRDYSYASAAHAGTPPKSSHLAHLSHSPRSHTLHQHRGSADGGYSSPSGSGEASRSHRRSHRRQRRRSSKEQYAEDEYGVGGGEGELRIDTPEAFWHEIEEILIIPPDANLTQLDNTLKMFVSCCSAYHDVFLPLATDMYQAVNQLLQSELLRYHAERMLGIVMTEAQENTNPHELYIIYHIILYYGHRHPSLFRSHRKWKKLLPTLGEIVSIEADDNFVLGLPPIEARIRLPATYLMYEVCRVQKLDMQELASFDEAFIDHLFEMVEVTRNQQDESLNYAVIKLILALNEQFMVSTLPAKARKGEGREGKESDADSDAPSRLKVLKEKGAALLPSISVNGAAAKSEPIPAIERFADHVLPDRLKSTSLDIHTRNHSRTHSGGNLGGVHAHEQSEEAKKSNRVLMVLMRRLGNSKTFGENIIFMLNRAENTPEDMCMQLLILKMLYLLFTTPGTHEYFFTNDLKVLLDVFIRELVDLPDEHEALRHTYLRVLYPLLNHTQLKSDTYKRPQIKLVLRSLISNTHIRDVNATTQRLVDRCLEQPRKMERSHSAENVSSATTRGTISLDTVAAANSPHHDGNPSSPDTARSGGGRPLLPHLRTNNLLPLPQAPFTSVYTSRDPVRQSSLNDVSESLAPPDYRRPRSATESFASDRVDRNDRMGDRLAPVPSTPMRRRPPPVPPNKKHSQNSNSTWSGSEDGSVSPRLNRLDVPMLGMSHSHSHSGSNGDLVEQGGKGVPPPIIEVVQPAPASLGWITFSP